MGQRLEPSDLCHVHEQEVRAQCILLPGRAPGGQFRSEPTSITLEVKNGSYCRGCRSCMGFENGAAGLLGRSYAHDRGGFVRPMRFNASAGHCDNERGRLRNLSAAQELIDSIEIVAMVAQRGR